MAIEQPGMFQFEKRLGNPLAATLANRSQQGVVDRFTAGDRLQPSVISTDLIGANLLPIGSYGQRASPLALSSLLDILAGQGKTDPMALNRNLADISRTTQGRQDALTGSLAAKGLGRSGVGAALEAAIGQGGAEQRAGAIAAETQKAEQQKRADLELFLKMIVDPSLNLKAIINGVPQSPSGPSSTDQILSLLATAGGAYLAGGCWVAAEVFDGWDDPRTHAARRYILTRAPKWFRDGYLRHGQALAERVRRDPALRDTLRPLFVAFAQAGR